MPRYAAAFFRHMGYGDVEDVIDDVRDRWGDETADALRSDLRADPLVKEEATNTRAHNAATAIVHRYVPAPLYLLYIEVAIDTYARGRAIVREEYMEDIADDPRDAPVAAPERVRRSWPGRGDVQFPTAFPNW